jgi:hypothetical protein
MFGLYPINPLIKKNNGIKNETIKSPSGDGDGKPKENSST